MTIPCPYCRGTGLNSARYGSVLCGDCEGTGSLHLCDTPGCDEPAEEGCCDKCAAELQEI